MAGLKLATALERARRERDEARRALNYARGVSEDRAKSLAEAKAQRDEARARVAELERAMRGARRRVVDADYMAACRILDCALLAGGGDA